MNDKELKTITAQFQQSQELFYRIDAVARARTDLAQVKTMLERGAQTVRVEIHGRDGQVRMFMASDRDLVFPMFVKGFLTLVTASEAEAKKVWDAL